MPSDAKLAARLQRARDRGAIERGEVVDIPDLDPDDPLVLPATLKMGLEEMVANLVSADEHERVDRFFARYGPIFDDLNDCPAVSRLNGLQQFGVKTDPRLDQFVPPIPGRLRSERVTTSPFLHSRHVHSHSVAAHAIALGLKLGLCDKDIARLALSALLHDVGHSAFSHDGDEFLVASGRPSHEERGQKIVEEDLDIRESLVLAGLSPKVILPVIREEGRSGAILKIMDTLAYVVLDNQMIETPLDDRFSQRVISSILDVRDEMIEVNDPSPLQELLIRRAELSRDVYYHPRNKLSATALQVVLRHAIDQTFLRLENIEQGTDGEINLRLTFLFNDPRRTIPEPVTSCWSIMHGFVDEVVERWQVHECPSKDEADSILASLPVATMTYALLVAPHDYTRKTIKVRVSDGTVQTLKAPDSMLTEVDKLWYVCLFKT